MLHLFKHGGGDDSFVLPAVEPGNSVPKVLHQHYLAGESAIPVSVRKIREALRERNPDWTYRFWDDDAAKSFIRHRYGARIVDLYDRIRPEYYAAKSDLLRYLTIYSEGGLYLDIKSTCDRRLDEAVLPNDRFLLLHFPHMIKETRSEETSRGFAEHFPELQHLPHGEYAQWVIAGIPGHPYLKAVIERVLRNLSRYTPFTHGTGAVGTLRVTGPIAYSLAIHPIRDQHGHTGPMSAADRGFHYSGLASMDAHKVLRPDQVHYGKLSMPLMTSAPLINFMTRAMHWSSRLPLIGPIWKEVHMSRSGKG